MSRANSFPHGLLWLGSTVFVLAYLGALFVLLPDTVVTHLNWAGEPDAWGERSGGLGFVLLVLVFVNGLYYGIDRYLPRIPISILNIPWKSYWCATPERTTEMYRRTHILLRVSGTYTNLVFLGVLASIHTTTTDHSESSVAQLLSFALLSSTIAFLIWILRFFRPPKP